MRSDQVLHFVQLAIVHFHPGMLTVWGDDQRNASLLADVHRLGGNFSLILRSISPAVADDTHNFCADCPTNRLDIIERDQHDLERIIQLITRTYNSANRIVVVRNDLSDTERLAVTNTFYGYNMVLLELYDTDHVRVVSWGNRFATVAQLVTFDGTEAIFHSHHPIALMFRQEFRQWHRGDATTKALLITTRIAPFHFMVQEDGQANQKLVASAHVTLIRLIGARMHFALDTIFLQSTEFVQSDGAVALGKHRGVAALVDYDERVLEQM